MTELAEHQTERKGFQMLVLSRRVGESVEIGPPGSPIARIQVIRMSNQQVRLAIDAPGLEINRAEIAALKAEQAAVALAASGCNNDPDS
jgi:carbon storage regulator CsrA